MVQNIMLLASIPQKLDLSTPYEKNFILHDCYEIVEKVILPVILRRGDKISPTKDLNDKILRPALILF